MGVVGSIVGSIKSAAIPTTFGFDTAVKVYSQLIGNLAIDAMSAKKYYYFIRLMGRSSSLVTLECALQTHPTVTLIGEEVEAKQQKLMDIVRYVADAVQMRAQRGRNYGIVLIPEGLLAMMPDMNVLISELNQVIKQTEGIGSPGKQGSFASGLSPLTPEKVASLLTPWSSALFKFLPVSIQEQLLAERDTSSGSVNFTQITTEKLLAELVEVELKQRKVDGKYKSSFNAIPFFFGYQVREDAAAVPPRRDGIDASGAWRFSACSKQVVASKRVCRRRHAHPCRPRSTRSSRTPSASPLRV